MSDEGESMEVFTYVLKPYPELRAELQARGLEDGSTRPCGGDLIARDLERYYEIVEDVLDKLRGLFNSEERRVFIESGNGHSYIGPYSADRLSTNAMAILRERPENSDHIDCDEFWLKMEALSLSERYTLVDAIERHCRLHKHSAGDGADDLFQSVTSAYRNAA